jgi:hypothetical protein
VENEVKTSGEGVAHAVPQGDRIPGYRKMTEPELELFAEGKELANKVGEYVKKVRCLQGADQRWCSVGQTQLQQGFMAVLRAIARPDSF